MEETPLQFAHTHPISNRLEDWEPIFTPFGPEPPQCRQRECSHCQSLSPSHGHLNKVAFWSGRFAQAMHPPCSAEGTNAWEWGYAGGLWHDLGKFPFEWQAYLKQKGQRDLENDERTQTVDHSTAGGQHAVQTAPLFGHLLAFPIMGHHSGLPNATGEPGSLEQRLQKVVPDFTSAPRTVLSWPPPQSVASLAKRELNPFSAAFFTRMLFSCLVDADFLATEAFMAPERTALRAPSSQSLLPKMLEALQAHLARFGPPTTPVDEARDTVYRHALAAADHPAGFFSLTVPTGGGKTLSSLAFALKHAIRNGQQRIIYVIPFTSIIEQNAAVFRNVFRTIQHDFPIVLEHHSNLSPEKETQESRLAAENWDAPLVVTTAVQFYESLFAARSSQCRKLHHIANAVVILDEVQCLPVDYLKPCLQALKELVEGYHTSILLCTATPPAIHHTPTFPVGLPPAHEIIPNPKALFASLKRVEVIRRGPLSDTQIAEELLALPQVLAIVNTRRHAQELFRRLPANEAHAHLSALMCPAHRREVLQNVRQRLSAGLPVRLISTQLIEAGVDVDFPCVYRSMAGIDSIGQAAGRCNRNGTLNLRGQLGQLHLFQSEHQRSEAYFRDTTNAAAEILALHPDPLDLKAVNHFFTLYYHRHTPPNAPRWDTKAICSQFKFTQNRALPFFFQFRTAAERFRLIEEDQVPILIPYNEEARTLIDQLRNEAVPLHRSLLRALQSYAVPLRRSEFELNRRNFEAVRQEQFHILISPESHYSPHFGLNFQNDAHLIL